MNPSGGTAVIRAVRWSLLVSLALVALTASPRFASAASTPPPPTVSAALQKPLKAAQDLLKANKFPEAIAKLGEAQAMPGRTPYDDYVIDSMLAIAAVRTQDLASAAKSFEAMVNSDFMTPADRAVRIRDLARIYYQLKNYDKAIEYGTRAIQGGDTDEELSTLVAQAYYIKGDYKGALEFINSSVDAAEKQGKTPKEQSLQLAMSSCVNLKDDACTSRALEKLVKYYPKPEYWKNLIFTLRKSSNASDNTTLNIDRLALEVGALSPGEYADMAQLANQAGLPGEAQNTLEKALAANVYTDPRDKEKYTKLLDATRKQAAADKAQLAAQEAQTSAARSGDPDVKLGLAYLTYDQYDKAVAAIRRGLAKGGVKNPDEAQIALGIAELKLGNRDEAVKAFQGANSDPNLTRLAGLWVIHAQQG